MQNLSTTSFPCLHLAENHKAQSNNWNKRCENFALLNGRFYTYKFEYKIFGKTLDIVFVSTCNSFLILEVNKQLVRPLLLGRTYDLRNLLMPSLLMAEKIEFRVKILMGLLRVKLFPSFVTCLAVMRHKRTRKIDGWFRNRDLFIPLFLLKKQYRVHLCCSAQIWPL